MRAAKDSGALTSIQPDRSRFSNEGVSKLATLQMGGFLLVVSWPVPKHCNSKQAKAAVKKPWQRVDKSHPLTQSGKKVKE